MQPDATAGNAEEKRHPDSWHLTLASAKLFPHKWPRLPLQRGGCAEGKGPRGMSSMGNELHAPGGGACLMCPKLPLLTGLPFQSLLSSGVPGLTLLLVGFLKA